MVLLPYQFSLIPDSEKMSTTSRKRRGSVSSNTQPNKRSGGANTLSALEMELETGTIEVVESTRLPSEEVVDLTCEGSEPVVVDLTSNDSVEIVDEGPGRRRSGGSESYVLSSDEEGPTEREVYVSANIARPAFVPPVVNSSCSRSASGTVSCPICLDNYTEILQSGRLIVSTKCGHLFCSQCLRDALKHAHSCPTCRKKLTHKQYHPIYI
ncbi:E3 ubiquitin-protein ligase RNF4-like isoform X1 [Acipenser oxyrinchus oxyrinchus]|uniref:E3 ubiquitin-protein ligase RNF4 n=1 Tax=Acipenser oxyrinchus oxyrinchus TaxID=40147 RepID=A0AAD8GIF1_ACIOX|nr:E3 ubiquitin-protein ligase RNF4-like isoform X1 [Acipenser oxyrinchus oxyrinchus]